MQPAAVAEVAAQAVLVVAALRDRVVAALLLVDRGGAQQVGVPGELARDPAVAAPKSDFGTQLAQRSLARAERVARGAVLRHEPVDLLGVRHAVRVAQRDRLAGRERRAARGRRTASGSPGRRARRRDPAGQAGRRSPPRARRACRVRRSRESSSRSRRAGRGARRRRSSAASCRRVSGSWFTLSVRLPGVPARRLDAAVGRAPSTAARAG